jgi:hypothetical protein
MLGILKFKDIIIVFFYSLLRQYVLHLIINIANYQLLKQCYIYNTRDGNYKYKDSYKMFSLI